MLERETGVPVSAIYGEELLELIMRGVLRADALCSGFALRGACSKKGFDPDSKGSRQR